MKNYLIYILCIIVSGCAATRHGATTHEAINRYFLVTKNAEAFGNLRLSYISDFNFRVKQFIADHGLPDFFYERYQKPKTTFHSDILVDFYYVADKKVYILKEMPIGIKANEFLQGQRKLTNYENEIYNQLKGDLPAFAIKTITMPGGLKMDYEPDINQLPTKVTVTTPDGQVYEGTQHDNVFEGIAHLPDGSSYLGKITNGNYAENGTLTLPTGECYKGEYKGKIPHGKGELSWVDGRKYEGRFIEGKILGPGILILPNGTVYDGEFDGYNTFRGKATYSGGSTYLGSMTNFLEQGTGSYFFPNGNIYKGDFKDGKMHGLGSMTTSDGTVYSGQFRDNLPNGYGTMESLDGSKYTGNFKDGKMHGPGVLYLPDGKSLKGIFNEGEFQGGVMPSPPPQLQPL